VPSVTDDGRRNRVPVRLPASLVAEAGACARRRGDVLTDYVHHAVITATQAAEAGRGDLLPDRRPRTVKADSGATSTINYTASREQAARSAAALEAAGSSRLAVVDAALRALVAADGVWLDVRLPWEPDLGRAVGDVSRTAGGGGAAMSGAAA